jgi:2-polyprenyl-3-methyl-5-hydroxy-6-metoxy-1,4-benzoquinol methylase
MSENLELYAKVEPLLGIEEATTELHQYYRDLIVEKKPQTLLDVGCGDGSFLEIVKSLGITGAGIDLSATMIEKARNKGLSAVCQDINNAIGSYDVIVSIFDVLNFLNRDALKDFLTSVERLLKDGGSFYADINTEYGFSEVAQGVLTYSDEDKSLIVDAHYEQNQLVTHFTYFEKEDDLFRKSSQIIKQYFYEIKEILELTNLTLEVEMPITLYGDEPDKAILCFKKG